ncbi:hypothetical protein OF846_000215 [Rhodotorula toruloides]|nr:hypothetical protein OF846_000215 [Rhodotorula toruloides]
MDAEMATGDSQQASLVTLPPELLLRTFSLLDPQSLVRLSATCTILHAVARSETLWRSIVQTVVREHWIGEAGDEAGLSAREDNGSTWFKAASFLLPHGQNLGYFASSISFTSRISRVGIRSSPHASADRPPRYTIAATQMIPRNRYSTATPPPPNFLPFGAVRPRPEQSLLFISPQVNPSHPYAGASMELLEPTYDFGSHTFEITPEEGACLSTLRARADGQAPPQASSVRLRLALEPVRRKVERPSASSADLPGGANDQPWDPAARVGLHREALFALFSGRLPDRPWPTAQLVGLEELNTADLLVWRAGRTDPPRHMIKLGDGAFRGLKDWLRSPDGAELPLAEVVQPADEASGEDDEAFVTGFRIRAKRTPKHPPTSDQARGETPSSAGTSERWSNGTATTRRRGVGANGGMAVLWHGREQDPEETRRPITILRAGDEAEGGFVLRLPGSPPQPVSPPLPSADDAGASASTDDQLADAVDASSEAFFPVKAPARPLRWIDESHADEHGDIPARSLEGLWVGTYSAHGLEFIYITVGIAEFPRQEDADSSDSENEYAAAPSYHYVIQATKVTGDANVPSGQPSWIAILPPTSADILLDSSAPPIVPTISSTKFRDFSSLDPSSPAYTSLNNGLGPDWDEGVVQGYGRLALTGYTSPSWSPARVRFFKSEPRLPPPPELAETAQEKVIESVEEIQIHWLELSAVSTFRRVRI